MKFAHRFLFLLLISMFVLGCGEKTSSVEGKFIDGAGKPLSGISVIIKQVQPTQGYEQFETKTGADGVFRLSGCAPSSEYVISTLSDKWKSKVTKKIKTLEAGQNLVLPQPISIRFMQLKDGSILDTKTGMQWKIYPLKDITASNVLEKVKSLTEGGFTDWRLPSRAELDGLVETKTAIQSPTGSIPVVKTCCAWVLEPVSSDVDWKFYIEEDNELWSSSKETPDNRVVIVRNYSSRPVTAVPSTVAMPKSASPTGDQASIPTGVSAPAAAPQLPGQTPTKTPSPVRFASRKACAEKKAKESKTAAIESPEKPSTAPSSVTTTAKTAPTLPKTSSPVQSTSKASTPAATPSKTGVPASQKTEITVTPPVTKSATSTVPATSPKASPAPVSSSSPKVDTAKVITKETPKISETQKVVDKKPTQKTELAKAIPTKSIAQSKKQTSSKKAEASKTAADDISAEKGVTIYFESGSSKISSNELVKLKAFFAKVKNSKGTIVINGHSDASANGESTGNVMLSNDRSSSVLKALHKMGLSRNIKLEMGALGDSKPVASNDTPEGRKLNRRVEVNFMPE